MRTSFRWGTRCRDRRGVALPIALLGLVVVSLLVTAALLTSSTELALSGAHQDGTRALYVVDNALESYVGTKAQRAALNPATDSLFPIAADSSLIGVVMTVSRLRNTLDTLTTPYDSLHQRQTYAVVGTPRGGRGRSAGAVVSTERGARLFQINVSSGMTIGGNVRIAGNSTISDSSANCNLAGSPYAIQVTEGATITVEGKSATVNGEQKVGGLTKEQMVEVLLGGLTLQEAAKLSTIQFQAGEFVAGTRVKSYDSKGERPKSDKYNWGCPVVLLSACNTYAPNNKSYRPSVAVDAGGGTLVLEGDHGQGILIVTNGSLYVKGNFTYDGIVLVEKDLTIEGTGGSSGGVKIEGAVLALGENSDIQDSTSGNAVITYNRCAVNASQAAFNDQRIANAQQRFGNTTGWFEVIR